MKAKGLQDWLIQRVSAVILLGYILFLVAYCVFHPTITFDRWHHLFTYMPMRITTSIVMLSLVWHAWIGMWTVLTDYIKCPVGRLSTEIIVIVALLSWVLWGIHIIWSQ